MIELVSGQIIIFHQPRFPWNKGISLTKPPFGVRSCEVAIIWPDDWTCFCHVRRKSTVGNHKITNKSKHQTNHQSHPFIFAVQKTNSNPFDSMWKNMGGLLVLAMTLLDHQFLHRIFTEIHCITTPRGGEPPNAAGNGWHNTCNMSEEVQHNTANEPLDLVLFSNTIWYWSEIWHVISNQLLSHIIILIWCIRYVTHANFDFVMGCWRVRYINMPRSFWIKHLGLSQHLTTNPVLNITTIEEM